MRGDKPHLFLLGHSHGTDWVEYNVEGWLSHAKHNPAAQNATTLLQDSQKYDHSQQSYTQHIRFKTASVVIKNQCHMFMSWHLMRLPPNSTVGNNLCCVLYSTTINQIPDYSYFKLSIQINQVLNKRLKKCVQDDLHVYNRQQSDFHLYAVFCFICLGLSTWFIYHYIRGVPQPPQRQY